MQCLAVSIRVFRRQAWAFRGATWHASFNNASSRKTRTAVQMHFMPTRCKFRSAASRCSSDTAERQPRDSRETAERQPRDSRDHDCRSDTGLENAPELPTSERQRPPGIGAVLPPVIPLQGKAPPTPREAVRFVNQESEGVQRSRSPR